MRRPSIFVPTAVHYPHGYCARTTGARVTSAPGSDLLEVAQRPHRAPRHGDRHARGLPRPAGRQPAPAPRVARMCRNITTLRGLEPVATPEEIEAAARQYVRKVSGVQIDVAADRGGLRARRDAGDQGDQVAPGRPAAAAPASADPPSAAPDRRQGRRRFLKLIS